MKNLQEDATQVRLKLYGHIYLFRFVLTLLFLVVFVPTVIAAVSNLSTAYNLANISLALVLLNANGFHATPVQKSALSSSVFGGAIVGQLSFGYIGDCLGRGPAIRLTMMLAILGSFSSAFVTSPGHNPSWLFTQLCCCRVIMGVGVGGIYPLSATVAAESSRSAKSRGRNTSLVFSAQGVGQCLVPLVTFVSWHVIAYGNGAGPRGNLAWRFVLGFGAIPGLILAPFKARETKATDKNRRNQISTYESPDSLCRIIWETRSTVVPQLIGTAGTWFLFDISFYANALFAPAVLAALFTSPATTLNYDSVLYTTPSPTPFNVNLPHSAGIGSSIMNTLMLFSIALPGYFVSILFMDILGRKNIQLMGFVMLAILYTVLALQWGRLSPDELFFVYAATFFFSNFGPNATTFILPSETFAPEIRSSMNGLCAAFGKLGALLGSCVFPMLVSSQGYPAVFAVCAVVSLLGYLVTLAFVIDAREPLDRCRVDFQKQTPNGVAHYTKYGDYRYRLGPTFP